MEDKGCKHPKAHDEVHLPGLDWYNFITCHNMISYILHISFIDEDLDHDVSPYRMSYIAL